MAQEGEVSHIQQPRWTLKFNKQLQFSNMRFLTFVFLASALIIACSAMPQFGYGGYGGYGGYPGGYGGYGGYGHNHHHGGYGGYGGGYGGYGGYGHHHHHHGHHYG